MRQTPAQAFGGLQGKFRVVIKIHDSYAGMRTDGPLGKRGQFFGGEVVVVVHRDQRPGHERGGLTELFGDGGFHVYRQQRDFERF